MKIEVIPFEQPIGNFLLAVMRARDIVRIAKANPRVFDAETFETAGGIQREPSSRRVKEIKEYSETVDAAFPTPILLALEEGSYSFNGEQNEIEIFNDASADIVDGQHRVLGFRDSSQKDKFLIPVVFLLDATEEQKALIFAVINGKQTKVPASVVYDLFGVTKTRSPQKTAHEIARSLNSNPDSPWYCRLKMLGRKTALYNESLSQGTFVKALLPHISGNPDSDRNLLKQKRSLGIYEDCVFNEYFRKEEDSVILKVLLNLFDGVRTVWPNEWDSPQISILTKTTGFLGIMKALPELVRQGKNMKNLSREYFVEVFSRVKKTMDEKGLFLTSDSFPPSAVSENKIKDIICTTLR
jgi:DGQHR domain-containing protein